MTGNELAHLTIGLFTIMGRETQSRLVTNINAMYNEQSLKQFHL